VAVDAAGNVFIADVVNNRVRRVDAATGVITTVAGDGNFGSGGDGGPATAASLASPAGVAVDAAGNLFIADTYNNRIRKVAPAVRAGEPATYTFVIRNTGRASAGPVTVISVVDSVLGDLTAARAANGGADIVLAPGQAFTFSVTGPALNAGPVVSTVTVTARDDEGTTATASETVTVTVY
jgi:sugar lactone lactonase YvrE